MHRMVGRAFVGSVLLLGAVAVGVTSAPPTPASAAVTSSWTVYHGNPQGAGVASTGVTFGPSTPAWYSPALDGQLFGEPLEATGRVFVATENDTVYALSTHSGGIVWSTHLATPVPSGDLPCGDISPSVGITGTPVVDTARSEIFVVADELVGGVPQHHLVGLNLYSGAVELDVRVDPPGATTKAVLQRTALNLDDGEVVFGFGGNYGDCGNYHGAVAAVPEGGGTPTYYSIDATPGQREGAVWMGGAGPEVDGSGNIWVAVGNGSVTTGTQPYDHSDSVLELSPALALEQYFAPRTWPTDNATDQDLGSTAPALLPNGTVFQVGKSEMGYLLTAAHLGGVGGQRSTLGMCTGDADGGDAVVGTTVYVGCGGGVEAVQAATPSSPHVAWKAANGTTGSPIVAGGLVWSIDYTAVFGLTPATGAVKVRNGIGGQANHFATPSVGDGLLLAPGNKPGDPTDGDRVVAFAGSAGLPAGPTYPTNAPPALRSYWEVARDGGIFAYGTAAFHGSMGGHPLNAPVVGMAADPATGGYWEVARDGGVFAFDAPFYGSMGGHPLNAPISGIAATPTGNGYWFVAADGGIFAYGAAAFRGSMGGHRLNAPIVGMAATPTTSGYWEAASDGGIFNFGAAVFQGSAGGHPLNAPVVGIAAAGGSG